MTVEVRLKDIIAANAQRYACGFLFSEDGARVLLIEKRRPRWQTGRLNGIGGKLEPGETPVEAMAREAQEEAGIDIPPAAWTHVADIVGSGFVVHFFAAFGPAIDSATSLTDEPVGIFDAEPLPEGVIDNVRVIVALARDRSGISKPVTLTDHS